MSFVNFFYKQGWAVNNWIKGNPFRIFLFIGGIGAILYGLMKLNPLVGLIGFLVYFVWTMICLVCDGIYKHRTRYYYINRCKECGHFVEPKDDQPPST